jgi:D-methionine transport system ATP-binding protein
MRPLIEVFQLFKYFFSNGNTITALDNISLSIEKGDVFGIIGQSGAGKSTLLRCLSTLDKPSKGQIFFQGEDFSRLGSKALRKTRKSIGMIFQHFHLLSSRSVAENVSLSLEIQHGKHPDPQKKINELLELVGLLHKKDLYPSQLSGGEKQRVAIARALANDPKVLFCDEATSALDPKTTKEILQLLKTLNQKLGLTIVLITHEMDVIKRICNKVAVIHHGTIIEQGSVLDVFSQPKENLTQTFLQNSTHELPLDKWKEENDGKTLLRLHFRGEAAHKPVISHLITQFGIEVNILLGWIDFVQSTMLGTLTVEIKASPQKLETAFSYLKENKVRYEVLS